MTQERIVVSDWPALMSTETAARYTSLDETKLIQLAARFGTPVVDLEDISERWRKQDLDKLIRRLPHATINSPEDLPVSKVTLDKAQVDAIANVVATRLERASGKSQPKLVSIKDAGAILGVGRSSVYRMLEDGRLESLHIGSRSLIQMASIEAILDGSLE